MVMQLLRAATEMEPFFSVTAANNGPRFQTASKLDARISATRGDIETLKKAARSEASVSEGIFNISWSTAFAGGN